MQPNGTEKLAIIDSGNTKTKMPESSQEDIPLVSGHACLGWIMTAIFIVAEMAGGGIVTLPRAMVNSSWYGLAFLFIGAICSAYTGVQLGYCWTLLQERWPEYRQPTRKPYPEIARRAIGDWAKHLVSFCITLTLFGVCVVFLLLSAQNIQSLILLWSGADFSFCYLVLILAIALSPVTLLGSLKDVWFVAYGASGATSIATVLIIGGISADAARESKAFPAVLPSVDPISVFCAYGTFMFAYGGHAAFPSFQHDMKDPKKFTRSVYLAYLIIILMYGPIAMLGYLTYGAGVKDNILENIEIEWCREIVTLLITIHLLSTFIILTNPINKELENAFRLPNEFGLKRLLLRLGTMAAIIFTAETIPKFGIILDLIGGSTVTLMTFIFPGIFYLLLHQKIKGEHITKREMLLTIPMLALGLVGGIASVYSSISSMITGVSFTPPCYVSAFYNHTTFYNHTGA